MMMIILSLRNKLARFLLVFVVLLGLSGITQAATLTWNGSGGTSAWSNAGNWNTLSAPVSGDAILFDGTAQLTANNNISGIGVNGITFNAGAGAFTISGNNISIQNTILNNSINTQTFTLNASMPGSAKTLNASAGNIVWSGVLSGSFGVNVHANSATGSVTLSGANTYNGETKIGTGGTLVINSINSINAGTPSSLGTATSAGNGMITFGVVNGISTAASKLIYTGTGGATDRVINLTGTTNNTAVIDQSGTGLLKFTSALTGNATGSKTLQLQGSTSGAGEISGVISNATSTTGVIKAGTGTWNLSGANTYTGSTVVSNGTLLVSGSLATGSAVTVAAGATLGGAGTVGGAVTTSGATSAIDPSNSNGAGVGILTLGALNAANGGIFRFNLGDNTLAGSTYDQLAVTGLFTGSASPEALHFLFTDSGLQTGVDYKLITFGQSAGLDSSDFKIDNAGWVGTFAINGNDLSLNLAAVPEPSVYEMLVIVLMFCVVGKSAHFVIGTRRFPFG
jgi:autotransporter-associated beta strand protein